MTFDGSSWVNLGIPGFTVDTVAWTRLRFSQVGQPYVAFNDWSNSRLEQLPKGIRDDV